MHRHILKYNYIFLYFFLFSCIVAQGQSRDTVDLSHKPIPHKTLGDILLYPLRSYVKKALSKKVPYWDTAYIISYKRKLTVGIPITRKYLRFDINDKTNDKHLYFSPSHRYSIGLNVSSYLLSFIVNFGIRVPDNKTKGRNWSLDYAINFTGKKVISELTFQYYTGFYIEGSDGFQLSKADLDAGEFRQDIHSLVVGLSSMYIFNYKRFSYRGAFGFAEAQKKSAGSFMAGPYISSFNLFSGDSALVRPPYSAQFDPSAALVNRASVNTLGAGGGYAYTLVWKRFLISGSLTNIIGYQLLTVHNIYDQRRVVGGELCTRVDLRMAIRYDQGRYFFGIISSYDRSFALTAHDIEFPYDHAKTQIFFGYRFHIEKASKRWLKKMNLINY